MTLRFTLIGPKGAVAWYGVMTNWVPGNIQHGHVEAERFEDGQVMPSLYVPADSRFGDGYAGSVSYHSPVPTYEGQQGRDNCHLLPEGTCYWDEGYMAAEPVLEAFLNHGPHAVWVCLARHYQEMSSCSSTPTANRSRCGSGRRCRRWTTTASSATPWSVTSFGGDHDGWQDRYCTHAQAEAGHQRAVAIVRGEVAADA